jgi:predicted permease
LFGSVALATSFLAVLRRSLDDGFSGGPGDAAPTRFAIFLCFFLGRITLRISLPCLCLGYLHDSSVNADPALSAVSLRFLLGRIALQVFLPSLGFGDLHNAPVDANPALRAIPLCFFLGGITLQVFLPGF